MTARLDLGALRFGLMRQLLLETQGNCWFAVQPPSGQIVARSVGLCYPTPQQSLYAKDLLVALNKHVDFDGSWIVAWTDPVPTVIDNGMAVVHVPERLIWLYKDKDCDTPFLVDTEEPMWRLLNEPIEDKVQAAALAHQEYRSIIADVGIRPDQMRRRAQGEAARDPSIRVIPMVG
jgi:hypothetical protein